MLKSKLAVVAAALMVSVSASAGAATGGEPAVAKQSVVTRSWTQCQQDFFDRCMARTANDFGYCYALTENTVCAR